MFVYNIDEFLQELIQLFIRDLVLRDFYCPIILHRALKTN